MDQCRQAATLPFMFLGVGKYQDIFLSHLIILSEQKLISFVRKLCLMFQVCCVSVGVSVSTNGIIVMYSECHQVNIFWQDPGPSHLLHVDVADTKTNIFTVSYGHQLIFHKKLYCILCHQYLAQVKFPCSRVI